jgi:hypothetical protein
MSLPSSGSKNKPSYLVSCGFLVCVIHINSENGGGGRNVPPKRRMTFNGLHGVISLNKFYQFLVR